MTIFFLMLFISCALVLLYLLAIKPNLGRSGQLEPFQKVPIAHRGFFDNHLDCPENSLAAFQRAVAYGYGIELDVQLTKDNRMVVFHDESLKKLCGVDRKLIDCTYEELKDCRLLNTSHGIPLLAEVLALVNGKVPLIIEIKPEGRWKKTARQLSEQMAGYQGAYCIQSFHPLVVGWYKRNNPAVIRGILSTNFRKNNLHCGLFVGFLLTNLLLNWYCKPDFIAYNYKHANEPSYRLCRSIYPVVNAVWTIRSRELYDKVKPYFSIIIFENEVGSSHIPL